MSDAASAPPAIILSLDGGGVRGLSSLFILERILEGISNAENLGEVPSPSQIFSLIGGTGTGGIIAIMLGRLGMTVRQSIKAYKKLIKTAPAPKLTKAGDLSPGCFSASDIEKAIKEMVQEKYSGASTGQNEDLLFKDESCTKTKVSTFSECTVLEVAKAVSTADTILSDSMTLGEDEEVFIGAEYGYNNPCEILISEAEKVFPKRELIILSIGTGITKVVEINNKSKSLDEALAKIAASSKACEIRLHNKYHGKSNYQRFNVENGLREIKPKTVQTVAEIAAHSRNYVNENEASIAEFVDLVKSHVKLLLQPVEEQVVPPVHSHTEQEHTPVETAGSDMVPQEGSPPPPYSKRPSSPSMLNPRTEQAKEVVKKLKSYIEGPKPDAKNAKADAKADAPGGRSEVH
ncbi:Vegetative incompatibility protein HET-E-1 [Ceratocystis lukuohia]|uniref:Vegetative incompatibility protein HET-E-1 n=1 Tax=Ceratocystis lukuohia TaxID=2019550 RepID=A0ABR4MF51_9PEZI